MKARKLTVQARKVTEKARNCLRRQGISDSVKARKVTAKARNISCELQQYCTYGPPYVACGHIGSADCWHVCSVHMDIDRTERK